ncbi:MAG: SpaA isopeptide-forming pilin-related protein [Peptostreptococcaceae bacterium]|nr:SpaA isopeptide-forming pilin-related protein [Peptostreptococcaceae bacterium]
MEKRKNIIISMLMTLILMLTTIFPTPNAFATGNRGMKKSVGRVVTDVYFSNKNQKEKAHTLERWGEFQVNIDWDAAAYGNQLQEGDYFEITLPKTVTLTPQPNYDTGIELIQNINGTSHHLATLYLEKDGGDTLQKFIVVFQKDVERVSELKGTIEAYAIFQYNDNSLTNQDNYYPVKIKDREDILIKTHLRYRPDDISNEIIMKWEKLDESDRINRSIGWFYRLNVNRSNLQGATIIDRLETPGVRFNSQKKIVFTFQGYNRFGEWINENRNDENLISGTDYEVTYNNDFTEMRIFIKSNALNGKSAKVTYWTDYDKNIDYVKNSVRIVKDNVIMRAPDTDRLAEAIGEAKNISGIKATITGKGKGILKIVKKDASSNQYLNGAKFKLTKNNKIIAELTTGSHDNGQAFSQELSEGIYQLTEINAPDGYLLNPNPKDVEIVGGQIKTVEITNEKDTRTTATIIIKKTDEQQNELGGATFEILSGDKVVDTITTETNGEAISKKLSPGRYKIRETAAPIGYILDSNNIHDLDLKVNETKRVHLINRRITTTGTLIIQKINDEGAALDGAKFRLTKANEQSFTLETPASVNGQITIPNLEEGQYLLEEIAAPTNHILDTSKKNIEIIAGKEHKIKIINNKIPTTGYIEIIKKDNEGTMLTGAEFRITKKDDTNFPPIELYTAEGKARTGALNPGKYIIQEFKAPSGYETDSNEYTVEVTAGEITRKEFINQKSEMEDMTSPAQSDTATITIQKTDVENNLLDGAFFEIYSDESLQNLVDSVESKNGIAKSKPLPLGKYWIKETKAPDGYILKPDAESIELKVGGGAELTITNEKMPDVKKPDENGAPENKTPDGNNSPGNQIPGGNKVPDNSNSGENNNPGNSNPGGNNIPENQTPDKNFTPKVEQKDAPETRLIILKKDADSDMALGGAKFKVSKDNVELQTLITDNNGMITLANPEAGKYLVEEIEAPENYTLHSEAAFNKIELDIELNKEYTVIFSNLKKQDGTSEKTPADPVPIIPDSVISDEENSTENTPSESGGSQSSVRPEPANQPSETKVESKPNESESKTDQESKKEEITKENPPVEESNKPKTNDKKEPAKITNRHSISEGSTSSRPDNYSTIDNDGIALHGRERTNSEKTFDESDIDNDGIPHSGRDKDKKSVSRIASTPKTGMRISSFDIGIAVLMLISMVHILRKSKES